MKYLSTTIATLFLVSGMARAESLQDIYDAALQSDPQLATAEASYEAALQAKPLAKSAYLPQINASAGISQLDLAYTDANPSFQDSDFNRSNWGIRLNQAIYNRGYWAQIDQADSGIAQAEAQILAERQGLIIRVATAYFDELTAREALNTANAEKTAVGRQLEQAKEKFDVGLIAITDVHESQASYDLTVANAIAAQAQLDISHESLRAITGTNTDTLDLLGKDDVALTKPNPADIDDWVTSAKENNLQLKAANYAVASAKLNVKAERSGHYPTLGLVAQYGSQDDDGGQQQGVIDSSSIGLDLVIPLYSGGRTTAQVKQAKSQYKQAQMAQELALRSAIQQVRASYLSVISSISQVGALKQALASTQTAAEAAQAGYDVGTRTSVDVLLALQQTYRAQLNYSKARHQYILSHLRLKQAAGTLTEDDLSDLKKWF